MIMPSLHSALLSFVAILGLTVALAPSCKASMSVQDDLGRKITLSGPPQKIVSLEPSVTEILYAVGAERKIVADDNDSDYPPAAKLKPHVNGIAPSRELMIGLQPDLIVLFDQTFTVAKADQWQQEYGVPVYVLSAGTYIGVEGDIKKLGALVGNPHDTENVIRNMVDAEQSVAKAVAHRPKVTAFVVVWDRPLMTAGRGSFVDDLIRLAGGIDVASETVSGYPTYSPERLVKDNPSYLLLGTVGSKVIPATDPVLAPLNLVADKSGRSWAIPDDWTSRPGPRLALGLCALAEVLHPESFKKNE
jgi:iron complex transport system substrate-binding protein